MARVRRHQPRGRWGVADRGRGQARADRAGADGPAVPVGRGARRAHARRYLCDWRPAPRPGGTRSRSSFRKASHRAPAASVMIPVAVLTGFLGSGKTTLLRRLLQHPDFARTAVIINEFGEVGIDHDLVAASEESFVELLTGCLCCAVRGDLAQTLEDLLHRRDAGTVAAFERIVIETSGLADPAPILHTLMSDAGLAARLALAGVVATVDAVNGLATLEQYPQSVKQVALADRLILTKTDLAHAQNADLSARLAALNPSARRLEASFGNVDPAHLFDIGHAAALNARDLP